MAISIRGTPSAWTAATATTQTVTLPTHVAGDMLLVRVAFKHATMPTTVTCGTAGWAKVSTQYNSGTNVSANGSGSVIVAVFWKEATSASETSPVITYHATVAATPSMACAVVYQRASTEAWATPVGAGGPTGTATAISATIGTHISTTAGDMVDFFYSQGDNWTLTVPTFTQAGLTLGTVSEQPATAGISATSNDIDADGGYRLVSSGTSSAAAVVTGTAGTGDEGSAWTTRLRVVLGVTLGLIDNAPAIYGLTVIPDLLLSLGLIDNTVALGTPTIRASNSDESDGVEIVVIVPAGTTNGDVLFMAVYLTASTGSITTPAGWTALYTNLEPVSSTSSHASLFWRVASSEPASYTVTHSSGRATGSMIALYGVDTTSPVMDSASYVDDGFAELIVPMLQANASSATKLLAWGGGRILANGAIVDTFTWDASTTALGSVATSTDGISNSAHGHGEDSVDAGLTGSGRQITLSGGSVSSCNWISFIVLVNPSSGAAGRVVYSLTPSHAAGPQTITLGLIDGGAAVYDLTVVPKNTLTLGLIDGASAIYDLTVPPPTAPIILGLIDGAPAIYSLTVVAAPYPITLGLIDASPAIYNLTLVPKNTLTLGFIDAGSAVYALTIAAAPYPITLGFIDAGSAVYDISASQSVALGLIDGGSAIYDISASQSVALGLIDGGSAIYDLAVSNVTQPSGNYSRLVPLLLGFYAVGGTPQTVVLDLIDGESAIYALAVVKAPYPVVLGLIDSGSAIYSLIVIPDQFVEPGLIDSGSAIYSLTLVKAPYPVVLGLIDSGSAIYSLMLVPNNTLSVGLIDGGSVVYSLVVSAAPYPITLGLIDGGPAIYDLSAVLAPYPVTLGLIDGGPAIYDLTAAHGLLRVTLDVIDAGPAIYDLTVERIGGGATLQDVFVGLIDSEPAIYSLGVQANISLGLIDSGSAVYNLTVTAKNTLVLGLVDGAPAIYSLTLIKASYPITLGFIDSGPVVYSLVVYPDQFVTLDVIGSAPAVYALTVIRDEFVVLGLVGATASIYGLTVVKAPYPIVLGVVGDDPLVYSLSVVPDQGIILPLVGDGWAIYDVLAFHYGSPQSMTVGLIVSTSEVYRLHVKRKWSLAQKLAMSGLGTGDRYAKPREYRRL